MKNSEQYAIGEEVFWGIAWILKKFLGFENPIS
jgi:hypothetical protein